MQLLLPLLLSGSLISALPLSKRDASTVLADLSTISSDVASLDSDVTSYDGSFLQSLPLIIAVDGLESDIKTATSDTTAAGEFTDADSESIVTAINTLTPNIIQLLTDLDAKSSVVASAGYTSVVESALNTLQTDTNDLFTALEDAISEDLEGALSAPQEEISAAFTTAIADFAPASSKL